MGLFDWLGPISLTKRRGWDALPVPAETKASPTSVPPPPTQITTLTYTPPGWQFAYDGGSQTAMNSAVAACLQAIATAIAEPELRLYRTDGSDRVEVDAGDLGRLLERPNPYMSFDTVLGYISTCLHVDGNAYVRKLRSGDPETGRVEELWPIAPSRMTIETTSGSGDFITRYRYAPGSKPSESISPANIVHFRYGLNDRDHRLGAAPLKRLLREISSDDQATRYADRLLANLAVNGLSLEWDAAAPSMTQADADEAKARIKAAFGGDNVGDVAVVGPGGKLVQHGFSPEQMSMEILHRVPEERISAVLGVPAIVAGLGAGLQRATYSNVREAREMFTEQKLIPLWRQLAATITLQLLPDFDSSGRTVLDFDITTVRALGDDQNAAATRLKTLVEAGILTADEARIEIGYEPRPEQDVLPSPVALPAAASRRLVRALVPDRKAAEDLPDRYADLRDTTLPTWEDELAAFFAAQQRRVNARLRAGADVASDLVTEGEAVLLGSTLEPLQQAQLGAVSRLVAAELGIAFQLDDPKTREYLRRCGLNIGGITETTRAQVEAALTEGQQAGEGIPELARRLRELPAFTRSRAETVARTELGVSQSHAAIASYQASGVVVGVRIHDGHDFDAPCADRDGTVMTLEAAASQSALLLHPRCTAAWAPITDAAELTRSA